MWIVPVGVKREFHRRQPRRLGKVAFRGKGAYQAERSKPNDIIS